jgi:hypothetical protein
MTALQTLCENPANHCEPQATYRDYVLPAIIILSISLLGLLFYDLLPLLNASSRRAEYDRIVRPGRSVEATVADLKKAGFRVNVGYAFEPNGYKVVPFTQILNRTPRLDYLWSIAYDKLGFLLPGTLDPRRYRTAVIMAREVHSFRPGDNKDDVSISGFTVLY